MLLSQRHKERHDMNAKKPGRTVLPIIVTLLTVTCLALASTSVARADNTTFYVNNLSGSNCSDAGAGTSQSAPWCDFTPVNSRTFGPGDHILLARGASWNQQMTLNGSGSAGNPAVLDAYGSGSNPSIIRNGSAADRGIRMNNPSYWNVSNLEIGHAGTGILVYYTTTGHAGLNFSGLYLHHIYGIHEDGTNSNGDYIFDSSGLEFTGPVTINAANPTVVQNITIGNVEGTHNQDSIAFDWDNGGSLQSSDGTPGVNGALNVTLQSINLHDDDAAGDTNPTCPENLRLTNMSHVLIFSSILNREPACGAPAGTASVFLAAVSDINFTNNILANVPDTHSYDETAIDHEALTDQVHLRDNFFGYNAGAAVEYLTIHPPSDLGGVHDYSTNEEVSGNVFVNDGINNPYNSKGGIQRAGTTTIPTGTIHDNLYYEPEGFTHVNGSGDFSGFTFTNNLQAVSATSLYNGGYQFSGTQGSNQWSYQYTTNSGANWTNLPNFDGDGWSLASGSPFPRVRQFDIIPDACAACSTARAWTAPSSGTLSIRGRILKADNTCGDGAVVRITRNGTTIWGPQTVAYNDRSGIDANVDNVAVSQSDVLRFEINPGASGQNACDWSSWDPSIGYTAYSGTNTSAFTRYYNSGINVHWVTTGTVTSGYNSEGVMGYLFNTAQTGTQALYGCHVNSRDDYFISPRSDCEGQTQLRLEGWIYTSAPGGISTSALYRCWTGHDHFVSFQSSCEGQTSEGLLGYARTSP